MTDRETMERMKTIPLTKALKGATKGPLSVDPWDNQKLALVVVYEKEFYTDKNYIAHVLARHDNSGVANAALLAHCRNELPGLVKAVRELMTWREITSPNQDAHHPKYNRVLKALQSASNVKIP